MHTLPSHMHHASLHPQIGAQVERRRSRSRGGSKNTGGPLVPVEITDDSPTSPTKPARTKKAARAGRSAARPSDQDVLTAIIDGGDNGGFKKTPDPLQTRLIKGSDIPSLR